MVTYYDFIKLEQQNPFSTFAFYFVTFNKHTLLLLLKNNNKRKENAQSVW